MSQPVRNGINAPKKKTARKKLSRSEIIKKNIERGKNRKHPKYGTSKLEERFAKNFLDKLGVEYEYQFEAKDIKRFYDFYIPSGRILLEVDGIYYHGKGLLHEEKNKMQKHNEYVDKIKNEWAREHGYRLYRIWEDDINECPEKVMKFLRAIIEMIDKNNDKKNRH